MQSPGKPLEGQKKAIKNEISFSLWLYASAALIIQLKQHNSFKMETALSKL